MNLLKGLKVGRLRVATSETSCEQLLVPIHEHTENLEPAFMVGLIVAVNSPELWQAGEDWSLYFTTALLISSDLHKKLPIVSTEEFRERMSYRAGFAVGTIPRAPMGYGMRNLSLG